MDKIKLKLKSIGNIVMPNCTKSVQTLLLSVVILGVTSPVISQPALEVDGFFFMEGTTKLDPDPEEGEYSKPDKPGEPGYFLMPLDKRASPWELPPKPESGMWVYANDEGRVRTYVQTGYSDPYSQFGYAKLFWAGDYEFSAASETTATINRSWLDVFADQEGPLNLIDRVRNETHPYAKMNILIEICGVIFTNAPWRCVPLFKHDSHIRGIWNHSKSPLDVIVNETWELFSAPPHALPDHYTGGLRLEFPSHVVNLGIKDIWAIDEGEAYRVQYTLEVEAGQDADEHYAEAILGDPLDVDVGGITLNTTHTSVPSNIHICEHTPDPTRFTIHADGTVTDTNNGLMWQRCPSGYTLNEAGTPADLDDDLCVAGTTVSHDWQSALQTAASDSFAGYSDWKLSDVKQLESLVELSCYAPTIDTQSFPDTPSLSFWSSTPAASGEQAWRVGFAGGDVSPASKTETSRVRLVRDSGTAPVVPTPGLIVGNASVIEGDSGTTTMNFRIELTRPASADVSVDYLTQSFTATEVEDYVAGSGSLTIPAGELSGTISVTVNGDTSPENNELVWLVLSNPSADVYLSNASSLGTIIDDEPIVSVASALPELAEGDSGTQTYEFVVSLDKPAVTAFNVDYTTADNTATGGEDYDVASGTLSINVGEESASILATINGDTEPENDEIFDLVISNLIGDAKIGTTTATATIIDDDGPVTYQALNDTGVTYCADATSTLLSCPQSGFPLQDGEFGRDVTDNDSSDGVAGFSFTKLDSDGVPLVNQAVTYPYVGLPPSSSRESWDCVEDGVTKLFWETKTDVANHLRNANWTYTWYNSTGINDGGDVGMENGGVCVDSTSCDTEKYIAAINAANLCSHNDWRLPTVDELYTLAITAAPSVGVSRAMDINYFPNHFPLSGSGSHFKTYWSANTTANLPQWSWALQFQEPDPLNRQVAKSSPTPIRLVRGGQ